MAQLVRVCKQCPAELSCSCSEHCRGGHALGKPNVSCCWHLAACAVIHQLPTARLQEDANVAETNCVKQQFFSSLPSCNFRCRKSTSVSQTVDSALFIKMGCANMQKTEGLPASHHLTSRGKSTKKACKNDTIIILKMKLQGKDFIQELSIKPPTLSNGRALGLQNRVLAANIRLQYISTLPPL